MKQERLIADMRHPNPTQLCDDEREDCISDHCGPDHSDMLKMEQDSKASDMIPQPTDFDPSLRQTELHKRTILYATPTTPAIEVSRYGSQPPSATTPTDIMTTATLSEYATDPSSTSTSASTQRPASHPTDQENFIVANVNLDSYFDDLRKEFEIKTGRTWTPLKKARDEEWDWESELVEDVSDEDCRCDWEEEDEDDKQERRFISWMSMPPWLELGDVEIGSDEESRR